MFESQYFTGEYFLLKKKWRPLQNLKKSVIRREKPPTDICNFSNEPPLIGWKKYLTFFPSWVRYFIRKHFFKRSFIKSVKVHFKFIDWKIPDSIKLIHAVTNIISVKRNVLQNLLSYLFAPKIYTLSGMLKNDSYYQRFCLWKNWKSVNIKI